MSSAYGVHRQDQEDGSIRYEVYDERPESYRFIVGTDEKRDAEQIALGLNLLASGAVSAGAYLSAVSGRQQFRDAYRKMRTVGQTGNVKNG